MLERLRELGLMLKTLIPWSLGLKLALSAVIGLLAGPGLLGFLSEYAAYRYALYYGIRPPLEGIPYLTATITLGSFLVLLAGALVFTLTVWAMTAFAWMVMTSNRLGEWMARKMPVDMGPSRSITAVLEALPLRWQIAAVAGFSVILEAFIILAEVVDKKSFATVPAMAPVMLTTSAYTFLALIATVRPSSRWWIGSAMTIAAIAAGAVLLFIPSQYAKFLRWVGYGGGLPITVQVQDEQKGTITMVGFLMLRTTEALILFDAAGQQISEIPRAQVRTISHRPGGLMRLPTQMPSAE